MTGLMQAWFHSHMDVVYFVYGFAFIAMGTAVGMYIRIRSAFRISQPLWLLVVFGISHGITEWLHMFALIKGGAFHVEVACVISLMVSYIALFEFGRRLNIINIAGAPCWLKRLEQRNGAWMTVALVCAVLAVAFSSSQPLLTGNVMARYFLGLPAAMLSGIGMFLYYRSEREVLRSFGTKKYFYAGGIAFLCYGVFAGLIVPAASFFPANVLNNDSFKTVISIPVQLFRALCAVVIAWAITGILKIFQWERSRDERRAQEEIRTLKQQIEFILGATKTGLDIIDADYNLRYVDPAWKKIYGEYEGRKCYDYFMRRNAPCQGCGIKKALETKQIAVTEEILVKEGNRPIQVMTIPFKDVHGEWLIAEVNVDITERKKAEQAIRESEEKYRLIVENAQDPITIVDETGKVLMLNTTAARHLRGVPADFTGRNLEELFPKPYAERMLNNLRRVIASGIPELIEGTMSFPGGERWFSTRIHPTTFAGSERPCALTIARDITDHKLAEQEIRKFKMIADNATYGVSMVDMQGKIIYANKSFAEVHGYSVPELIGRDISVFHAAEQMPEVRRILRSLLTEGNVSSAEVWHMRRDGTPFPMLMNVLLIRDEEDRPLFVATTATDITEQKQAQERLRESEERYRTLVENVGIGVAMISPTMEILTLNNQMKKWFPNIEIAKKPICYKSFVVPPRDAACPNCPTRLTLADGKQHETVAETSSGNDRRSFRVVSTPLFDERGSVKAAIEMVEDITERRQAEKKLELFRNLLDQSNDAIYIIEPATGRFLDVNEKSCFLLGYSRDELLALTVRDIEAVIPDAQAWKRHVEEVRSKGYVILEGKNIRKDKSTFPVDVNVKYIEQEGKAFMVAVVRDATERKRAEDELKYSEEKYRTLIETTDTGFLILDGRGRVLDANAEYVRLSGHRELSEIVGRSVIEWTTPRMKKKNEEALVECVRKRRIRSLEIEYISPQGTVIPVEINATVQGEGASLHIVSLCRDITNRKKAEEALRESEQQYRNLVSNLPSIVYRCHNDADWTMSYISGQVFTLLGYPPSDFVNNKVRSFASVIHPDDRVLVEEAVRAGVSARQPYTITYRLCAADGREIWVHEKGQGIFDQEGRLICLEGVIFDISEQRRMQEALRRSEAKYHDLVDTARSIILMLDREQKFVFMNKYGEEFFGYRLDELAGRSVVGTIVPETDRAGNDLRELIDQVYRRPEEHLVQENENIKKNGERVWISWANRPIHDESGNLTGILSVGTDITERKRAEERIVQAARDWTVTFESMADGVTLASPDFDIVKTNGAVCSLLGKTPEEILGKKCFQVFHGRKTPIEACPLHKAKNTKQKEYAEVFEPYLNKWLSISVSPVLDEAGRVTMLVHLVRDITARRQAEDALRKAYADLQEMQNSLIQSEKLAALGRFSLGVAHEIKNPLGIILGGIEYLDVKMPHLDAELKETMKKVEEATVRADRIVHTLLRFARPADLKTEKIRPEDMINETISFLKYRAPVSNIKITTNFMNEKVFVNVDKNQIQQVLFNLLMNAVEAMPPEGGTICVKTDKTAHRDFPAAQVCVIEVSDTGTGITRDNLKRMFEPFFTTKRDKKGTGLGLPVSKTIVNNHKGDMVIESEEGKGTTVRVTLPIVEG